MVDDGSIDSTSLLLREYSVIMKASGLDLITIYQQNAGAAAALNKGLKAFRGDYLCWIDCDDYLRADSIGKKVRFLQANREYGLVRSDGYVVDEVSPDKPLGLLSKGRPNRFESDLFKDILFENTYLTPGCYMVRSSCFFQAFPDRQIYESRVGQNWQLLLPLTLGNRCGFIDEPLFYYVMRQQSHSHEGSDSFARMEQRFAGHKELLLAVLQQMGLYDAYHAALENKYTARGLQYAVLFGESQSAKLKYEELKKLTKPGWKETMEYLVSQNRLLMNAYNAVRKWKRGVR